MRWDLGSKSGLLPKRSERAEAPPRRGVVLAARPARRIARTLAVMLRLWMVGVLPFLNRWMDVAPAACCGVCGTCLTAAASGLTIEAFSAKHIGGSTPN